MPGEFEPHAGCWLTWPYRPDVWRQNALPAQQAYAAVAAAISLFGFNSGAALATVVGVLIEVPVMLTVVAIVNRSRSWYERQPTR